MHQLSCRGKLNLINSFEFFNTFSVTSVSCNGILREMNSIDGVLVYKYYWVRAHPGGKMFGSNIDFALFVQALLTE